MSKSGKSGLTLQTMYTVKGTQYDEMSIYTQFTDMETTQMYMWHHMMVAVEHFFCRERERERES